MSLGIFGTETVDRVRPAMVSDHGRDIPDWDAEPLADDPIDGCSVDPGASDEVTANRSSVVVRFTLFAPSGSDITEHDGIRYDGTLYQVDGKPEKWKGLGLDHIVAYLVDWEG